jgi:hypothetical protein
MDRKGKSNKKTISIPRSLSIGVPLHSWVKLRYVDKRNLDPGTDSTISWIFSANGVYDPDITGTGGQPRFFDQWAAMYGRYCVEASSITAVFIAGSSTSTYTAMCGIDVRSDVTAQTTYGSYLEGRLTRVKPHVPNSGGPAVCTVKHGVNVAKWFALTQASDRDSLTAATSANPAQQLYYHVFASDADPAGGDPGASWCTVTVDYTLRFYDPLSVVAS